MNYQDLIGRLRDGVKSCGLHDDNETELFLVDDAAESMAEAADVIESLTAQLAAGPCAFLYELKTAGTAWAERNRRPDLDGFPQFYSCVPLYAIAIPTEE